MYYKRKTPQVMRFGEFLSVLAKELSLSDSKEKFYLKL